MAPITKRPDHGVAVPIWRGNCPPLPEEEPFFWLIFYGVPRWQFNLIVEGGEDPNMGSGIVRQALRRRGLDPDAFWTSFWFIQ